MAGPFTITTSREARAPNGEIVVPAHVTLSFTKACELLHYLDTTLARVRPQDRTVAEETPDFLTYWRAQCKAEGEVTDAPHTPPDAEAEIEPTDPDADVPPKDEDETPDTLGAPKPKPVMMVDAPRRSPGESDGRPLAKQYYAAKEPMPLYDAKSIVAETMPDPADLERAIDRVVHNEPDPGREHHDHSRDTTDATVTAADPVDIFSGRFVLAVTDATIPSRGFPLQFNRVYRSGAVYFGPWGYNWDHCYNVYLRVLESGDAAIWTGRLTEEVYRRTASGAFESPVGAFRLLEFTPSTVESPEQYVLSDRDGVRQVFERPAGWPLPDRIPLVRIEDRHGNTHALSYDTEGRLTAVSEAGDWPDGWTPRYFCFAYGDCGLLEDVHDHTGRHWRYEHDVDIEHLVAVTTPATDEAPSGRVCRYEYDRSREHPALVHNLIRVIDPAGQVVVDNQYGDDPDTDDFGRVVWQAFGDSEVRFEATRLQYVAPVPEAINAAALQVAVDGPGVVHVYTFNYRGDLLDERFRLRADGSFRLVVRSYRYDEQGNVIEARTPGGLGLSADFDSTNTDPRARGNLLRLSLRASPVAPAQSRELWRLSYEPAYHRIKEARDETGAATTFIYDYEATGTGPGDVVRIEHPQTTMPDGTVKTSIERFSYNERGQLLEYESAAGRRFQWEYGQAGNTAGLLRRVLAGAGLEPEAIEFGYDDGGNVRTIASPSGATTVLARNALGQLVRISRPGVGLSERDAVFRYARDGQLARRERPRGAFQDDVIADASIHDDFVFDALGFLQTAVIGSNADASRTWRFHRAPEGYADAIHDPLGRVTRREYDERGLVLREALFADSAVERSTRFGYDRNGNVTHVADAAGRRADFRYDAWDRLVDVELPGREDERTHVLYAYGPGDQIDSIEVVGTRDLDGAAAVLVRIEYDYDERGRLTRWRRGNLGGTVWFDEDGLPAKVVDQRGATTTFTYDAVGRQTRVVDAVGNAITRTFDADGNMVAITESDIVPGVADPELHTTRFAFDARRRVTQVEDALQNRTSFEHDDRDLLIATVDPLGVRAEYDYDLDERVIGLRLRQDNEVIEHRWQRDPAGRLISYTDPDGRVTRYRYDATDCCRELVLADGTSWRHDYNVTGELIREATPSGVTVDFVHGADGLIQRVQMGAPPALIAVPDVECARDGLGRLVRIAQGATTVDWQYDASGRLVRETADGHTVRWSFDDVGGRADFEYPDGRIDRYELDPLGRFARLVLHRAGTAELTGPLLDEGTPLATWQYRGRKRLHRRVNGNGSEITYGYDRGRRLTDIAHRAQSGDLIARVQYVFDAVGRRRVVISEPVPGTSARFAFDDFRRLVAADDGLVAAAPPENATQAEADQYIDDVSHLDFARSYAFTLAGSDGREGDRFDDGETAITSSYTLTAVHQIARLTREGPLVDLDAVYSYDPDGRRTRDDRYAYRYDATGRLREVWNRDETILLFSQQYDPLGRAIASQSGDVSEHFRYAGLRRVQDDAADGTSIRQRSFGIHADELILQSGGTTVWTHQDARRSLLALSDDTGAVLERYRYEPFGVSSIWAADGVTRRNGSRHSVPPTFGGHRLLEPIALYDARARIYDPEAGCFLQPDPSGYRDGPNLYAYANHNPIDFTDPLGMERTAANPAAPPQRRTSAAADTFREPLMALAGDNPYAQFAAGVVSRAASSSVEPIAMFFDVARLGSYVFHPEDFNPSTYYAASDFALAVLEMQEEGVTSQQQAANIFVPMVLNTVSGGLFGLSQSVEQLVDPQSTPVQRGEGTADIAMMALAAVSIGRGGGAGRPRRPPRGSEGNLIKPWELARRRVVTQGRYIPDSVRSELLSGTGVPTDPPALRDGIRYYMEANPAWAAEIAGREWDLGHTHPFVLTMDGEPALVFRQLREANQGEAQAIGATARKVRRWNRENEENPRVQIPIRPARRWWGKRPKPVEG